MDEIDWNDRLIGIKGTRGVGKTTFLLQYTKEKFGASDRRCLYVNMNNFYFQSKGIAEFAGEFVSRGGEVLLIDQVFKQPNWSKELRLCYDRYPQLKIIFTGSSVMRLKEDAHDYRYFPDPDLLPVIISNEQLQKAREQMPELPKEMVARFVNEFGVSEYDARLLTVSRFQAAYFETAAKASNQGKLVANWINGELAATLNKEGLELAQSPITAARLAALVGKIADGTLSSKLAKKAFEAMWAEPEATIEQIIDKHGLVQITDTGAIEAMVDEVLANNAKAVEQFKAGNEKALNAIVGQVMKASKGKANPAQVQELVKAKLG